MDDTYLTIAKLFSALSLSAFGGGNTVLPSMHMAAVSQYHWMTNQQFLDLFSISKAAPGPSTLIVELIALKATGFPQGSHFLFLSAVIGAVISILAMFVPSSILLLIVSSFWEKILGSPWQRTIEKALMPMTTGLILASTWIVARTAISGWVTGIIGFISLVIILKTKINPILIMLVAALLSRILLK
jgi:chromate transporter